MDETGRLSSQRAAAAADLDPQRAAEWLPLRYPQRHPWPDPSPARYLECCAFVIANAVHLEARALWGIRERR